MWVPSEFSRQAFAASGVDPAKLVVVPEGINTSSWDPSLYRYGDCNAVCLCSEASKLNLLVLFTSHSVCLCPSPVTLPQGVQVFGPPPPPPSSAPTTAAAPDGSPVTDDTSTQQQGAKAAAPPPPPPVFRFLSTFKWEPRKGWDVLLDAYLNEFRYLAAQPHSRITIQTVVLV